MNTKTTLRATFVAAASACLLLAGGAQAAELATGVYYGGGNNYVPGNWTVTTDFPVELGLRAHVYQQSAPAPTGNVYNIALGSVASFDWSFDNFSAQAFPTNIVSSLTITNLAGGSVTFDPLAVGDNASNPNGLGGEQNSWRLSFGFLNGSPGFNLGDLNYDANVNSTYNVVWSFSSSQTGTTTNSIVIQQGSGLAVPEPSTWALMILGFGGAGAAIRSRRRRLAA